MGKHAILVGRPILAAAAFQAAFLFAQADIEARFEAARHAEEVAGDLQSALNQYNSILSQARNNRSLAARILLQKAQCEERLGHRDDARLTYARILKDYRDQSAVAARARERLAAWTRTPQGPHNLDFERKDAGWTTGSGKPVDFRQEGCRGQLGCAVLTGPGKLLQSFAAVGYRGKTVRLRAWLKGDRARAWLAVDRRTIDDAECPSSAQWAPCEVAGEIDPAAQSVELGILSTGAGRVWIDGLSFQPVPETEIHAARNAIDKAYGILDSAYLDSSAELAHHTTVTAIRLTGSGAIVTARAEYVRSEANRARSTSYVATRSDTWIREGAHWKLADSRVLATRQVDSTTDAQTAMRAAADLKRTAAPLATLEVGHTFYDLTPFGTAVGDARIVALGEATYGTREFFEIKHRLFEYLVREKGFSVFAINANWPEATALDLYIKSGEGDPKALLTGMLWPWNTQEALDLVEWMRDFNQSPGAHPTLSFASFGMAAASVVIPRVITYLKRYSPLDAITAQTDYAPLLDMESRLGEVYDNGAANAAAQAGDVLQLLDAKRDALIQASSEALWRDARQAAEMARQAAAVRVAGQGSGYANEMMARNIEWLANDAYPGQKILLWAHNSLVSFTPGDAGKTLGTWLREEFGERIYVTGFACHRGELLAIGVQNGQYAGVARQTIPHSSEENGDSVLSAAGMPVFFLDLRSVPAASALGRWLMEPHSFLEVGALWNRDDPQSNWSVKTLSKSYDGLVFLEQGHAARGL
jgi:erythromycin esterase